MNIDINNKLELWNGNLITNIITIIGSFKQKINWVLNNDWVTENSNIKSIYKISKWVSVENMKENRWLDIKTNKNGLYKYLKYLDNNSLQDYSEVDETKYWYYLN